MATGPRTPTSTDAAAEPSTSTGFGICTVRNCTARNYNGDGISAQISDGVQILNSESYGHSGYGVHPGTGSANTLVKSCKLYDNGQIGLFLCGACGTEGSRTT